MITSWFRRTELYPWAGKPSIYDTIKEQLDEHGRLREHKLPDDEQFWDGHSLRWVSGGMDGAFGHHGGGGDGMPGAMQETLKLLVQLIRKPGNKARRAVYMKLMQQDALSVIDRLMEALRSSPGIQAAKLYEEAYWFASHGAHRNVVKFGMALLGMFETEGHRELLMTLGKHDEFTLYAAVAIRNTFERADDALLELARCVHGWGKIQLVERIEPATDAIKDWLLRDGCENSVMYEYLAYTCAVKGELHRALEADVLDEALYRGAGIILSSMIAGGPAEDIDDYEQAEAVIGHFLRHSSERCTSLRHLVVVIDILQLLEREEESWLARYERGWTFESRERHRQSCTELLSRETWPEQVWQGVRSEDEYMRYTAIRAAKALQIDLWPELFRQLKQSPLNEPLYYELVRTEDSARILAVTEWAERELPVADIASGPAGELGLGPAYRLHNVVCAIVQHLDEHPGVGRKLIGASLLSPVVRNRNMALNALEAWPLVAWGASVITSVKSLAELEQDESIQERVKELIDKHEL